MYLHKLADLSSELQCCVLNKICLTLSRESGTFGADKRRRFHRLTVFLWNSTGRTRVLLRNQGKFGHR